MYFALTIFSELLSFMTLHLVTEYLSILGALGIYFYGQNTQLRENQNISL